MSLTRLHPWPNGQWTLLPASFLLFRSFPLLPVSSFFLPIPAASSKAKCSTVKRYEPAANTHNVSIPVPDFPASCMTVFASCFFVLFPLFLSLPSSCLFLLPPLKLYDINVVKRYEEASNTHNVLIPVPNFPASYMALLLPSFPLPRSLTFLLLLLACSFLILPSSSPMPLHPLHHDSPSSPMPLHPLHIMTAPL